MKIPEIPLKPDPSTDEAKRTIGFEWNDTAGKRHKLGGEPQWLQNQEIPSCTSCSESMTFYGQLDSIGDDIVLADCGLVYVFVCFGCFTTTAILQSS